MWVARSCASVTRTLSRALCAERPAPSPSSPASRWPATTPGPSSRSCGLCCGPRSPRSRTPKTLPEYRVWVHRPDLGAASGVGLVVGTRLSVTARAGLDDALAAVQTVSIGSAPPYLPCTHVHTDDLRGSLRMLTRALRGRGRPTGVRVPDVV